MAKRGRPRRYDVSKAYDIYSQKYDSIAKQQAKYGLLPKESKMSKADFVADWEENRQYYGPKYSGKQVAEALAKKDVYPKTFRQGKAIFRALESDFPEMTSEQAFARQYQRGLLDDKLKPFWDMVKTHTQAMRDAGYSWDEIKIEISQQFFGS